MLSNEKFPELADIAPYGVTDPMISWNSESEAENGYASRLITVPAETGGMPILFGSHDKTEWHFVGQLSVNTDNAELGGSPVMVPESANWQRVSLFTVHDLITDTQDDLLIFSVEGLDPITDEHGIEHFKSSVTSGYLVGALRGTEFHVKRGFTELDFGLNFFYPRTCAESTKDGVTESTIMQGLISQDDEHLGDAVDGMVWRNSLSIPRRLLLEDGQLSQHFIFPYLSEEVHETEPFGRRLFFMDDLGAEAKNFHILDESDARVVTFEYRPGEVGTVTMINGDERRVGPGGEGSCHIIVDGTAIDTSFADGLSIFSIAAVTTNGHEWKSIEVEDV